MSEPVANPVASFTETGLISQFSNRNQFDFEVGSRQFPLKSPLRSPLSDASREGQKLPSDHPAKPPPRFLPTLRRESSEAAGSCWKLLQPNPGVAEIPLEAPEKPLRQR